MMKNFIKCIFRSDKVLLKNYWINRGGVTSSGVGRIINLGRGAGMFGGMGNGGGMVGGGGGGGGGVKFYSTKTSDGIHTQIQLQKVVSNGLDLYSFGINEKDKFKDLIFEDLIRNKGYDKESLGLLSDNKVLLFNEIDNLGFILVVISE